MHRRCHRAKIARLWGLRDLHLHLHLHLHLPESEQFNNLKFEIFTPSPLPFSRRGATCRARPSNAHENVGHRIPSNALDIRRAPSAPQITNLKSK